MLVDLFDAGLAVDTFHVVGHSLGSHVAGYAGRTVIRAGFRKYILPRITSLDPAGPLWYVLPLNKVPLGPNDAAFVDIIHTDNGKFGGTRSTGHVDFYPNGGRSPQPSCSSDNLLTGKLTKIIFNLN